MTLAHGVLRASAGVATLAAIFAVMQPPIGVFVWPPSFALPENAWPAVGLEQLRRVEIRDVEVAQIATLALGPRGCMAVVQPVQPRTMLVDFCAKYSTWVEEQLLLHGGLLFRGWNVSDVRAFDRLVPLLIPGIEPELYLGTSPRTKLNETRFVSTASEIPPPMTIPEHIEIGFKPRPPRRIAFYAAEPNDSPGGETPVADFRAVWRALPPDVRERFRARGLRYERWYYDKHRGSWDPQESKAWQDMFATADRAEATAMARAQGFTVTWEEDTGAMGLTNIAASAHRVHSVTGDEYWGNHLNVLRGASFPVAYAWAAQLQGSLSTLARFYAYAAWVGTQRLMGLRHGCDVTHADGGPIAAADVHAARLAIMRHAWVYVHEADDVVLLDNQRVAHGRQPWYGGPRRVYVAWF